MFDVAKFKRRKIKPPNFDKANRCQNKALCLIGLLIATTSLFSVARADENAVTFSTTTPLLTIPERFYGINLHPGTVSAELKEVAPFSALKIETARIMTKVRIAWTSTGVWSEEVSPGPGAFNWNELDKLIEAIVSVGAEPYLALGAGAPQWLADPAANTGRPVPSKISDLADVDARIVQHCVIDKHYPIRRVSIENEPDMRRYNIQDYIKLFNLTADKIKKLQTGVLVGGPANSFSRWTQPDGSHLEFSGALSAFKSGVTNVDFIDWHVYTTDVQKVSETDRIVKSVFGEKYPLVVSELNRDWRYTGSPGAATSKLNNTGWGSVAWLAEVLDNLQKSGVNRVYYFPWRDDSLGLVSSDFSELRPNYFTLYSLINLVGRKRINVVSSSSSIGVIATTDGGYLRGILYNTSDTAQVVKPRLDSGAALASGELFEFNQQWYENNKLLTADKKPVLPLLHKGDLSSISIPPGGFVVLKYNLASPPKAPSLNKIQVP